MAVVGWIIWGLVGVWTLFSTFTMVVGFVSSAPAVTGDGHVLAPGVKRAVHVVYVIGFVAALVLTLSRFSKLHLLWFAPAFHFFGTQWITLLNLSRRRAASDPARDVSQALHRLALLSKTRRWRPRAGDVLQEVHRLALESRRSAAGGPARGALVVPVKTGPGPDTSLRRHPLIYLYFDDIGELVTAFHAGRVKIAIHQDALSHMGLTTEQIADDPDLLLHLYGTNRARFRLPDGFEIIRGSEDSYVAWYQGEEELPDATRVADPELRASIERDLVAINLTLDALRRRYGTEGIPSD